MVIADRVIGPIVSTRSETNLSICTSDKPLNTELEPYFAEDRAMVHISSLVGGLINMYLLPAVLLMVYVNCSISLLDGCTRVAM